MIGYDSLRYQLISCLFICITTAWYYYSDKGKLSREPDVMATSQFRALRGEGESGFKWVVGAPEPHIP